jgi:hypothetical protein
MDESFDPSRSTGVFVAGGLIGRGVQLFELDRKWEKLRKRSDIDIPYYKASQCEAGTKEFRKFVADPKNITPEERKHLDLISHEFITLIPDERDLIVHGVGVAQPDFYEVIKDANAKAILGGSPYRLAYDLAMIQCAWAMKKLEESIKLAKLRTMDISLSREYISFVCDEDEEHGGEGYKAYSDLKRTNPNAAEYMGSFSSADDKQINVLQAADAVAFEIRRALHSALGQWKESLRKQFNMMADTGKVFLIQHVNKENLLNIVATHKPAEPFKLDEIMEMHFEENVRIGF